MTKEQIEETVTAITKAIIAISQEAINGNADNFNKVNDGAHAIMYLLEINERYCN